MSLSTPYGLTQANITRALIGGDVIADTRNELLKQLIVATANKTGGGGGGTGNVVGPASSTDGAVVLWDGLTGKLLKDSTAFITGSGTLAFGVGPFTLTVPATGTAALLEVSNIFTLGQTIQAPVGASALTLTGGTQTANFPVLAATQTWDNAAVAFRGIQLDVTNTASDAASRILYLRVNGISQFTVSAAGALRIGDTTVGDTLNFRSDIGFLNINGFGGQSGTAIGGETYLSGINFGKNSGIRWTNDGTASTPDLLLSRDAGGIMFLSDANSGGATLQMAEQTAPAAPAASQVRIYAANNGAGKTQLMALFSSGAAQQIAIQP